MMVNRISWYSNACTHRPVGGVGRAHGLEHLVHLVQVAGAGEQRELEHELHDHDDGAPHVHLAVVAARGKQQLRRPVLPGSHLVTHRLHSAFLGEVVYACQTEISQFYHTLTGQKQICNQG